jgi:hypothetical protein
MSDNRKRLDRIASALTPKQAVLAWIVESQRFDSRAAYGKHIAKQPFSDHPFRRLADQVADGVRESLRGKPNQIINEAVLKNLRETAFLYSLRLSLEERVAQDIHAAQSIGVG